MSYSSTLRAGEGSGYRAFKGAAKDEIEARLAEIPDDRRDLTARICGDPVFERSALYQKIRSQSNA